MKPKHQRLVFIAFSVLFLCVATLFGLRALRNNMIFYYSPSEVLAHLPTSRVRMGGLVEEGSVQRGEDNQVDFNVTDGGTAIPVHYRGMLPALFREGQGVVVEGLYSKHEFAADHVLTKHDEKYMPKDVVDRLKKSGQWRGDVQ